MSGVDVLAVMDAAIRGAEQDGKTSALDMRAARAAVAELIEAGRDFMGAPLDSIERFSAAEERFETALAHVTSGAA